MEHQNGVLHGEIVAASAGPLPARQGSVSRAARDEIAEKWLRSYRRRSEHTVSRYRRDITVFFEWTDREGYDVFAMLPWHVGEYADWLATGDHSGGRYRGSTRLSPQTQSGRIAAVSSFFRFVQQNVQDRYLPNPAEHVERPRLDRESKTRGLVAEELEALRAFARAQGPRDYALVQLLAGTGLRISEVVKADTNDLRRDGSTWYLYVVRKGKADLVPVQVPAPAVRALHRYLRGRRGPLFLDRSGGRMSRQAASNRVQWLAVKAGIADKRITPHSLRHTATTLALSAGVHMRDVAALMGHSSMETTARYDRANRLRDNPAAVALGRIIDDDTADEDQ